MLLEEWMIQLDPVLINSSGKKDGLGAGSEKCDNENTANGDWSKGPDGETSNISIKYIFIRFILEI